MRKINWFHSNLFTERETWVEGVENVKKVKMHFSHLFAEREFNKPV